MFHGSKLTGVLIAALLVFLAGYVIIIIAGSGVLPGDTGATDAMAPAAETASGSGVMDLKAGVWTSVVLIGTALLGLGLALAQFVGRQRPEEEARTEAATRALHRAERDPAFKD